MKKIRTRLLSLLLVLVTVLSLLPTSALAASSTGTGIKPTNNTNYWTTRLLHDGTPYSYKPPMAAGKMLYCMDRGYGYRWGTASFLNSYTYTSATGADADTVLKTALAQSGLGELDAQQLENFKWMMTYIVDYTCTSRSGMVKVVFCLVTAAKVTPAVFVYHWVNIMLLAVSSFAVTVTVSPAIAEVGFAVPLPFVTVMLCATGAGGSSFAVSFQRPTSVSPICAFESRR